MRLRSDDWSSNRLLRTGVGAALMILGATAATLAIPEDLVPPGSLTLSGYMLAISLLAPTMPSWRNDVRTLLRGENILIAALIYWTLSEILQGTYSALISHDAAVREFMLITVTALGFWLGGTLGPPMAPRILVSEATHPWTTSAIFWALLAAFSLGVWDFLYRSDFNLELIRAALLQDRWSSPWQRDVLGDWSAFSYHLQYFGYLVPPIAVFLAIRAGWRDPKTWVAIGLTMTILAFHTQGGGRRIVGSMLLAALFCWLIYVRRFTPRRFLLAGVAFAGLVALLQTMLIYRGVGFGDESTALAQYDYIFVDDNFLRIGQTLDLVPEAHPFVNFQYIMFALVRPIPRVFWPDKPISGGFDLADLIGIPGTSFAITMAGELYVSYGYIAAFIGGLIYGRLSTMVNGLFRHDPSSLNPLFPSLILVWLFVGVRSLLEIMLMGYVLLAVIGLSKAGRFLNSLRGDVAIPKLPRIP